MLKLIKLLPWGRKTQDEPQAERVTRKTLQEARQELYKTVLEQHRSMQVGEMGVVPDPEKLSRPESPPKEGARASLGLPPTVFVTKSDENDAQVVIEVRKPLLRPVFDAENRPEEVKRIENALARGLDAAKRAQQLHDES